MQTKKVCVFGSYKSLDKKTKDDVARLGKLLAEKGYIVVSGGFGGTMEDVSRGAKSAGGKTVGVTYYKQDDPSFKRSNKFIDEEIRTQDIFERITVMMKNSDAFIVLPGGTGTLLELAAMLEHINKGMMKPKPIIAIGNFWKNVTERLRDEPVLSVETRTRFSALSCADLVIFVKSVEEAVEKIAG